MERLSRRASLWIYFAGAMGAAAFVAPVVIREAHWFFVLGYGSDIPLVIGAWIQWVDSRAIREVRRGTRCGHCLHLLLPN